MRKDTPMKKRLAALLAALLLIFPLASCAREMPAVTAGKTVVTANMYQYWASSYKAVFAYSYSDYADNDSFWQKELSSGGTVAEYLDSLVLRYVRQTAAAADCCDRLGVRLSDKTLDAIDARLDDLEADYADGSRNAFNRLLAAYGVNRSILREIYIMEAKVEALENALFAADGELALTDEARERYYGENYVRVSLILVGDTYRYATDENGSFILDPSTNSYVTVSLTDEEKAEKAAKIAEIDEKLAAGEDFAALEKTYSEAALFYGEDGVYPNGYYLTAGTSFVSEVTELAFSLDEGETGKVSTAYGTFFAKRLPLDEGAYKNTANSDFFPDFDAAVRENLFLSYLSPYVAEAVADEDVIARFSLPNVTPNYRY